MNICFKKVNKNGPYYKQALALIRDFLKEEHTRTGNNPRAFRFDIDELENNLQNANPKVSIAVALDGGEAVGYALFSMRNFCAVLGRRSLLLEDLYIKPKFRGRGLGRTFMKYLSKESLKKGCDKLEWWVDGTNKNTMEFYKSCGAEICGQVGFNMRLTESRMRKLTECLLD